MKVRIYHIILFSLLAFSGCIKPPEYDVKPEITAVSLSRNFISQLDSIRITLEFTDGDGDIGYNNLDTTNCNICDTSCLDHPTFNLFLFDSRTGCLSTLNVPFIPEKGSSDAISGTITVVSPQIFCLPDGNVLGVNPPFDTLFYDIQLKDRAGNISIAVRTPEIIVDC